MNQGPQTQGYPQKPVTQEIKVLTPIEKNNKIFAGVYLILQIISIVLFGIFVRPQAYVITLDNGLFESVGIALLVLVGFGLYFSYVKNNIWSGLGFNFLITAGAIQCYVIANAFWSKAHLQMSITDFTQTHISTYLSDQNGDTGNGGTDTLGNTAAGGFKCALAMNIIFAAIGGRAGPLQAMFITVFGTIFYQINRQVVSLFSVYTGGSTTIFLFGGIAGTVIALLLRLTKQKQILTDHKDYVSSKFNVTIALMGAAFIWVFFPVLNMDVPTTLFIYTNAGISTLFCISSSVVAAIGISLIVYGKLQFRDLITAPIAGGVIVGCSSTYIYNPLASLLLGAGAGILQVLFNNIDKRLGSNPFWSNGVFFLFGVQGFLGGIFSAVIRAINQSSSTYGDAYNSLITKYTFNQRGQISATFVSLGIGAIAGLFIFIFIYCFNKQTRQDCYNDSTYWVTDEDGISQKKVLPVGAPAPKEQGEEEESEEQSSIEVSGGESVKGQHAYL